jgi:hypothetical protein
MMSPEDPFFEQFTGAIDLSDGQPLSIAPPTNPVALKLASELLLLLPQDEPMFREVQDIRVVNLRVLQLHLKDLGVHFTDMNMEESLLIEEAKSIDRADDDAEVLPRGVSVLRNGESMLLGRRTSPALELNVNVSSVHANLTNNEYGLTFRDVRSTNGTFLFITEEDALREIPEYIEKPISDELRDAVYDAFSDVRTNDGRFMFEQEGLKISGTVSQSIKNNKPIIEILVMNAKDYPDLRAPKGYSMRRLSIDPDATGINIMDLPGGNVGQLIRSAQIREFEAQQAIKVAKYMKDNQ